MNYQNLRICIIFIYNILYSICASVVRLKIRKMAVKCIMSLRNAKHKKVDHDSDLCNIDIYEGFGLEEEQHRDLLETLVLICMTKGFFGFVINHPVLLFISYSLHKFLNVTAVAIRLLSKCFKWKRRSVLSRRYIKVEKINWMYHQQFMAGLI